MGVPRSFRGCGLVRRLAQVLAGDHAAQWLVTARPAGGQGRSQRLTGVWQLDERDARSRAGRERSSGGVQRPVVQALGWAAGYSFPNGRSRCWRDVLAIPAWTGCNAVRARSSANSTRRLQYVYSERSCSFGRSQRGPVSGASALLYVVAVGVRGCLAQSDRPPAWTRCEGLRPGLSPNRTSNLYPK